MSMSIQGTIFMSIFMIIFLGVYILWLKYVSSSIMEINRRCWLDHRTADAHHSYLQGPHAFSQCVELMASVQSSWSVYKAHGQCIELMASVQSSFLKVNIHHDVLLLQLKGIMVHYGACVCWKPPMDVVLVYLQEGKQSKNSTTYIFGVFPSYTKNLDVFI